MVWARVSQVKAFLLGDLFITTHTLKGLIEQHPHWADSGRLEVSNHGVMGELSNKITV